MMTPTAKLLNRKKSGTQRGLLLEVVQQGDDILIVAVVKSLTMQSFTSCVVSLAPSAAILADWLKA